MVRIVARRRPRARKRSSKILLYIVRHPVAHERDANRWPDDAKRPLAPEGEERFRRGAEGILRLVLEVGCVLSSPFVRAWRTAEILEQKGWPASVS